MKFTKSLAFTAWSGFSSLRIRDVYGLSVDDARNILTKLFLDTDSEFLMFIDNDASWASGSIERLISHNKPIVCGGMYTKDVPPMPTMGKYMGTTPDGKVRYHFQSYVNRLVEYCQKHDIVRLSENENLFPEPELMEIDGCGMHFTLIRRDVIEKVDYPWFVMQGKSGAGEDFYFCKRAKAAGYKLYTDLSVQTAHGAGESYDFGIRELMDINNMILQNESGESELHV